MNQMFHAAILPAYFQNRDSHEYYQDAETTAPLSTK